MRWKVKNQKKSKIETFLHKRFALIPTKVKYIESDYYIWLESYTSYQIATSYDGPFITKRFKMWEDAKQSCKLDFKKGECIL